MSGASSTLSFQNCLSEEQLLLTVDAMIAQIACDLQSGVIINIRKFLPLSQMRKTMKFVNGFRKRRRFQIWS